MFARDGIAVASGCPRDQMLPGWVPDGVRIYLSHTAQGRSLRDLAREQGCHASTVMRQVRRFENRRDDPLVDDALRKLDQVLRAPDPSLSQSECHRMTIYAQTRVETAVSPDIADETLRCLRHLAREDCVLVVAPDMPKAVLLRETATGAPQQITVLDRDVAEAMALQDLITCRKQGRVLSYTISPAGRAALRSAGSEGRPDHTEEGARRMRYGAAESPVSVLARRRDKSGALFLAPEQVHAAERLREDFVMAQLDAMDMAPADAVLDALERKAVPGPNIAPPGTHAARLRIRDVLRDLGPGLGDMALRSCCWMQGVEAAETELGWSARSGKIVLRIALERLSRHYAAMNDADFMMG
jgi:hypothetical protein